MPLPKSAVRKAPRIFFDPNAGPNANAWWWECQRGHKLRESAPTRGDIDRLLHEHDGEHHFGGRRPGADCTLSEAASVMLAELTTLLRNGKRREGTLVNRRKETRALLTVFGENCRLALCQTTRVKWYITQRLSGKGLPDLPDGRKRKSTTLGEQIVKELKCLHSLALANKVELDWNPSDEWLQDYVRPVHREKLWIDPEDLVAFIGTLKRLRDQDTEARMSQFNKRVTAAKAIVDDGSSLADAAKLAGLSVRSAWKWAKSYRRGGESALDVRGTCESKTSRVAYAYVLLKETTIMRDVELRELRKHQVDTREKAIDYLNRSKRKERETVAVIDDLIVEALTPLLKDKHPDAYVFDIDGRQLGETTLCRIIARAWRITFYDPATKTFKYPPQKYLSWIRHNVITELIDAIGLDAASAFANHTTPKVTEKHYNLDRAKARAKARALPAVRDRFQLA
jgi:hypothetical protein